MKIRISPLAMMVLSVLPIASCNGANRSTAARTDEVATDGPSVAQEQLKTAKELDFRGRHLEASVYFEAALDGGYCELEILPLLIKSQVRAGRLEAAKQNVARLGEIAPNFDGTEELARLLNRLTKDSFPNLKGASQ